MASQIYSYIAIGNSYNAYIGAIILNPVRIMELVATDLESDYSANCTTIAKIDDYSYSPNPCEICNEICL